MASYADRFEKEVRRLILERIEQLKANLAGGSAVSYDEYQKIVGHIFGLNEVIQMFSEAKTIIEKE